MPVSKVLHWFSTMEDVADSWVGASYTNLEAEPRTFNWRSSCPLTHRVEACFFHPDLYSYWTGLGVRGQGAAPPAVECSWGSDCFCRRCQPNSLCCPPRSLVSRSSLSKRLQFSKSEAIYLLVMGYPRGCKFWFSFPCHRAVSSCQ